jgi:hypothetical protein
MATPPIAFLVFNRPDETARTFAAIRAARPEKLFIIADGARPDRVGEAEKCAGVRAIVETIDWPCDVRRNYAEKNMGCGRRVASGISWVFEQVESAVILEDDCLPDPSFFPYCEDLLSRYRDNAQVMMISGNNFQYGRTYGKDSYYFSQLSHCWGWATWARAWQLYDYDTKDWPQRRRTGWLRKIAGSSLVEEVWRHELDDVHAGKVDTWDIQWRFCIWRHDGVSIVPQVNLVTNIGFGDSATHTLDVDRRQIAELRAMSLPLRHPDRIAPCGAADEFERRYLFRLPPFAALNEPYYWALSALRLLRPLLSRLGLWQFLRNLTAMARK